MASYKNGSITLENVYGKKTYETTIAECSSSIELQELTITENGIYTAPEGTGYSPVNVNVASEGNPMQEYVNNNGGDGKPSCNYLFYYYKGTNLDNILKSLDFSKVTSMSYMFSDCSNLTSIPLLDTSKVTNMSDMFAYCYKLTSIPLLDTSKVTDMTGMFSSCYNLKEIHMTGMKTSFDISASTKFTESALVEILNNLATVTSTKTLTMRSTNLAKLTDEEKAIATNKGWTLA